MSGKDQTLALLYFKVTDVWKRFCELHSELLDLTFEEYSYLLRSDIDGIESLASQKAEVVQVINRHETLREDLIDELNTYLKANGQKEVESVGELIQVMGTFEQVNNSNHLKRFNQLLIDIIEKLQTQNKKNQVFLNKAITNLKEIREEAMGVKNYSTYNQQGVSVKPLR
jgi:flagellar biosynthesis/type III secretory pathway chaperone